MNLSEKIPQLTGAQWDFLGVLALFDDPVSIDFVGKLAPLLPGPFYDLLKKTQPLGWIETLENNRLVMGKDLPPAVQTRLESLNTSEKLNLMARRIIQENEWAGADLREKSVLLDKAGFIREAGEGELDLAFKALRENRPKEAHDYLDQALRRFMKLDDPKVIEGPFISAGLEYSNLCFSLGQGFTNLEEYLLMAIETADQTGDRRSLAILHLHLGRFLYYFTDRRSEALAAFSRGSEAINRFNDEDILDQSAEFLGLFCFIQGLFREAMEHFDRAEKIPLSGSNVSSISPFAIIAQAYCATFIGQYHRAIGNLDFNWRLASERSNPFVASSLRGALGILLVFLKKDREGMFHLLQAQKEAEKAHNDLGLYLGGGGMALHYFLQGQMEKAYEIYKKTIQQGIAAGLIRLFAAPWFLEMIYEFHRLGFKPIAGFEFPALMERLLSGVNIHLKGVALRIQAKEYLLKKEDSLQTQSSLAESEKLLEQAGDPVQLSKTLLEIAKLELGQGRRESARGLIQRARGILGGYGEEFFPDEFRFLLKKEEISQENTEDFFDRYLDLIESFYPGETSEEIFSKMLASTSRFFGAERSALFWFPAGKFTSSLELKVSRNLTLREVHAESFKNSLRLIKKTLQTHQLQIGRFTPAGPPAAVLPLRSYLCLPIEIDGQVLGVLYYDNSYLDDVFTFSDPSLLGKLVRHTNLLIERRLRNLDKNQPNQRALGELITLGDQENEEIVHRSRVMAELLKQADHIAQTDSSVLILGETGTGKELLAKRIHAHSSRSQEPFMVVDVTTIPENLLESELFGHERGAFTGADSRKIGRLEIAHQGTLFLDEIGELPPAAQGKLLRVLQEKTFTRLGGIRPIHSHFRLIAATNRQLEEEVAAGRFRQDLFYRLKVIPLDLPPLRERPEDIPLLAETFLKQYAHKYKRRLIRLTEDQEKMLRRYRWPGNIRELKNVIERAVLLSLEDQLELNLPADLQAGPVNPFADFPTMDDLQRRYIEFVIKKTGGKIAGTGGAADILGMNRATLYSRMKLLGLRP